MTTSTTGRSAITKVTVLGLGLMALGACDTVTSAITPAPTNPFTYTSTVEASTVINQLDDRLDAASVTRGDQLPTGGTVNYFGMTYMNDLDATTNNTTDPVFYFGQMAVTASFAGNGSVTGVANNFIDGNNNSVAGSLTLQSTSPIQRGSAAAEFDGQLTGSITPMTGGTQDFTGLQVRSGFANGTQFVAGSGNSSLTFTDGFGNPVANVPFTFGYIAEQQ